MRARTLITQRWLALGGQICAILLVDRVLGYQLPAVACYLVIAVGAWLNLLITASPLSRRVAREPSGARAVRESFVDSAMIYRVAGRSVLDATSGGRW